MPRHRIFHVSQKCKAPLFGLQALPDLHPHEVTRLLENAWCEGNSSYRVPGASHGMILELQLDGKFHLQDSAQEASQH